MNESEEGEKEDPQKVEDKEEHELSPMIDVNEENVLFKFILEISGSTSLWIFLDLCFRKNFLEFEN